MQTAVKKVRVECADLVIGMYVCELDRPWLKTPFMIRGFYIKDTDDIDTVRNFCEYVFVDKIVEREQLTKSLPGASSAIVLNMSVDKTPATRPGTQLNKAADEGQQKQPYRPEQGVEAFFPGKDLNNYSNSVSWRGEAANAHQVIRSLYDHIARFLDISIDGNPLEFDKIRLVVEPMVDSVTRNPDACLWATTMKPPAEDDYDSALRASVFAVVLGRRLGLPHKDLCSLAMGGLLFDIGKLRLGDNILQADRKLTAAEMELMQRHVEIGLGILKRDGLADQDIIDFVANHHERFDGSGYPKSLGGDMIPVFGRLAGVVDCYNAITCSRKYASSRSPAEAINQLYKLKGVHFHSDLIEEFIHAIGVYPVGALVELSSGEVAIVVAQSATRRLRPIVVVLLDGNKNKCRKGRYINLEKTTHQDNGRKLDIVKNLDPDAYGIDRSKIRLS
jgi:HD-GYP domain-containing protein (c-di-GMP phosphodiesterase class II)